MKDISIGIIRLYQQLISPLLHSLLGQKESCLFTPTCSEYAVQSIQKYGMMQGVLLATKRILRCQRWVGTKIR